MRRISNKRYVSEGYLATADLTRVAIALSIALLLCLASQTFASGQGLAAGPKTFGSAKEAAEALIAAAETFDEARLKEILGPNSHDLIYSGEIALDREIAEEFGKMGKEKLTMTPAPKNPRLVMFSVGEDDWPSPLPIVKRTGGWIFDVEAGRTELLYRRIGRNELETIKTCRRYVDAQHEYALTKHDGVSVNQYARRIFSTSGKQDGLAWQNPDGSFGGPIGESVAKAIEKGYTTSTPYNGYYFKVLTGQGPAAPMGKLDFMVGGYMLGGFALLAFPSTYRVTGVKSFIVSHDGVVYEKDLGPNTAKLAEQMEVFNPDKTWVPVLDDEEDDDAGDDTGN